MSEESGAQPLAESDAELHRNVVDHLELALEATEPSEKDRHIREALQQPAIERGDLDA